jgi:hypothetical protein
MDQNQLKPGTFKKTLYEILTLEINYFDHLNSLPSSSSPSSKDSDDRKLLKKLKTIVLNFLYIKSFASTQADIDVNFVRIVIDILSNLYAYYVKIFEKEVTLENTELNKSLLEIVEFIVPETITCLNSKAFSSIKFCNKFIENNGLKILFDFISCPVLVQNYVAYASCVENPKFISIDNVLRRSMGSLVCLARAYSNYKNNWKNTNAVTIFLNYLKTTKHILDNRIYACMASAFVADDDDIERLPTLREVIPDLARLVGLGAKSIKENKNLFRNQFELDDSDNEVAEICCVRDGDDGDTQWSLVNLLKALYHLGVHDKLKQEIYYKNHMRKHLKSIVYAGNDIEKVYALNLVWQLCFDAKISKDIRDDRIFFEFLESLSNQKRNSHKKVKQCASGIVWQINNKLDSETSAYSQVENEKKIAKSTPTIEKNIEHIMISYNRDSRDMCLKIQNALENQNLKVWIDIDRISGSSLESMALAVENSFCVLICMTEKYKQSPNCRAEAEYTFTLNKPIIPLILQKDYKPGKKFL